LYQFSRSIYRELAAEVTDDGRNRGTQNRQLFLQACERAMERLAADRQYFSRPARSLFNEVRIYFPIQSQLKVLRVIEQHMALAVEYVEDHARAGLNLDGSPMSCHATTRKGSPCQRAPLPGTHYCPSHQHLLATELATSSAA
jgi:hypothetical protein